MHRRVIESAAPVDTDVPPLRVHRDLTVDLARVVCVLVVVVAHLLQVGIGMAASADAGTPSTLVTSRPLEQQSWFAAATWAGQIMPLFFVVGGFAAATGWRSWTSRGGDGVGFVRTRALRLAQPTLPLFVFAVIVLVTVAAAGAAPDIVDAGAVGVGMPLWFLAAYLLCQTAVPLMIALHERAPRASVALLAVGVVAVDATRYATGVDDVGLLNYLFVWLLVQQIGFWYFDGWFERRHPLTLVAIAVVSYALLWPLTAFGPYSTSMLGNLNPPTLPLVLLGVGQACILRLLHRPLSALMRVRAVRGFVVIAGARLMTIYLWHLPAILLVTGLSLLVPGLAPEPESAAWWWTRPLVFVVVLALLYVFSLVAAQWEVVGELGPQPPGLVVATGVALAFLPAFTVLQWGLDLVLAAGGALMLAVSVLLLRWPFARRGRRGTRPDAGRSAAGSLVP